MALMAVICFGVTLVLQPVLISVLSRARVLDIPNHRSSHVAVTPRGGGIGALAAVLVAAWLWHPTPAWMVLLGAGLLSIVGWMDDVRPLGSLLRLALQSALALLACVALWQWSPAAVAALPLAAFFVVGFVNAFNFMDGINGISGANAALMGGTFAWIGWTYSEGVILGLGAIILGCGLGFLPFNLAGRIFLGDVGSYLFGGLVGLTLVTGLLLDLPPVLMLSPVVIYLLDTSTTILARARRGEKILEAHRSHAYQRVATASVGHFRTSLWVVGCGAAMVSAAVIATQFSLIAGLALGVLVGVVYLASPWLIRRSSSPPEDPVPTSTPRQSIPGASSG